MINITIDNHQTGKTERLKEIIRARLDNGGTVLLVLPFMERAHQYADIRKTTSRLLIVSSLTYLSARSIRRGIRFDMIAYDDARSDDYALLTELLVHAIEGDVDLFLVGCDRRLYPSIFPTRTIMPLAPPTKREQRNAAWEMIRTGIRCLWMAIHRNP